MRLKRPGRVKIQPGIDILGITKFTSLKVWVQKSLNESWKGTWKQVPNTVNAHLHLKSVCFNSSSLNLIQYLRACGAS